MGRFLSCLVASGGVATAPFAALLFAGTSMVGFAGYAHGQSVAEIRNQIEAHLGKPLGILGPLPLSAGGVDVAPKGGEGGYDVRLDDLRYGRVDLGALTFTMAPTLLAGGDARGFDIRNVRFSGGKAYDFDSWTWQGTWDFDAETYREIDYEAAALEIRGADSVSKVTRFHLEAGSREGRYDWRLDIDGLDASGDGEQPWRMKVDRLRSQTLSRGADGSAGLDDYGQVARLIGSIAVLQDAGADIVKSTGSVLGQLPDLFATGETLMAGQVSAVEQAEADVRLQGLALFIPALDLEIDIADVSMQSTTQPMGDGTSTMDMKMTGQGLDIQRREDSAAIASGVLALTLDGLDLDAFYGAAQGLFGEPNPGDTWAFLSDLIAFYDDFTISAQINDAAFTMPDREVAVTMDTGIGAFGLSDMRQDGAALSVSGTWEALDVQNAGEVPEGLTPEPLVFYGRVLRYDPLTTAMIPRDGSGTFEIGNLPLAQVRQMLSFQQRGAALYDTGAVAREAVTAGLMLATPFMMSPPVASLKDVQVRGDAYRLDIEAMHNVNPLLPPLFGFGTSTVTFEGVDALDAIADDIIAEQTGLGEDEVDADLLDWATRIKGTWLDRARRYAPDGARDPLVYSIEATQTGQVLVNGEQTYPQPQPQE